MTLSRKPLKSLITKMRGIALERLHERSKIHTYPQLGFLSLKHFFALYLLVLFMKATASVLIRRLRYESRGKQINIERTPLKTHSYNRTGTVFD